MNNNFLLLSVLFAGCVNEYSAQEPDFTNCRQTYQIQPNTVQVIRSPGYPGNYPAGQLCQYQCKRIQFIDTKQYGINYFLSFVIVVVAPIGYQINLSCRVDSAAVSARTVRSNAFTCIRVLINFFQYRLLIALAIVWMWLDRAAFKLTPTNDFAVDKTLSRLHTPIG